MRAEDRLRARGDAEGGAHTWRCPPGSSRRRRLAGSPSSVVQGGSRTRTPARAPRFERGVSTVPATWTSQCPGRESNSHAHLERRLLRPVCLPVVPPPGRECGARGEGRTRMGREARWPLEPVCLPGGSTTRAQNCGSRIRTDGLRGMSPAICHLIYPAMNIGKADAAFPEGLEPPTSWPATRRSESS